MAHYEVQHFTLCEGWVNTWQIEDDNGDMVPETFDTYAEAQAALDEFFDDIEREIAEGHRAEGECYELSEFKIVHVK